MKPIHRFAITCGVLVTAAFLFAQPLRSQNPNVPAAVLVEQYRILPGANLKTGQPKPDQQIELELNALAAEGWKVRTANQTSIILAR